MDRCFVIQPFDGDAFDKRFDDVLVPAIEAADLTAYRVDRDPASTIPIEDISAGIAGSAACLCDITTDNPNVWFELGYAIASQKPVVLICAKSRATKFPFDVQHRTIINYKTDSPSDFDELKRKVTERLKTIQEKRENLGQIATMAQTAVVQGLDQFEMGTLVAVAQRTDTPDDGISPRRIREDMEAAGFTKVATTLGIQSLLEKQLIAATTLYDDYGTGYPAYQVTATGFRWLLDNKDKLPMHAPAKGSSTG